MRCLQWILWGRLMARNTYFSQGSTAERDLYEDMIIEAIKIYGQDVYYMPRTVVSQDDIFNEDIESKFEDSFLIEMYLESVEGFEGDGSVLSKFGLENRDSAELIVAKRTWEKAVYGQGLVRPNEGDLIYFTLTKTLMEIKFVEHEQPFYQLQNLPVYKLSVEAFEYGDEAIDTGIEELDEIELLIATRAKLTMGSLSQTDLNYVVGEVVTATDGAAAEVAAWDSATSKLSVVGASSNFDVGDVLTGGTSGLSATITAIDTMDAIDDNDPYADNQDFEDLNSNYIDFSEINPFGEVN